MSLAEDRGVLAKRWRGGLAIAAAALVFIAFAATGKLPPAYALTGFAIVAAAVALALRSAQEGDLARPATAVQTSDDLLRSLVAGLPDPVVALDRDGRVLALNERARALAPALRQGEPVSF